MANSFKKETLEEFLTKKPISSFSTATNDSGAITVFKERKVYREQVFPEGTISNMVDTWGKDSFYGLLSTHGNAILPNSSLMKAVRYSKKDKPLYAISFVADAFRDFSEKMRELATKNIVFRNSPWARPTAVKAVSFSENSYDDYMLENVFPIFNGEYLQNFGRNKEIKDFQTFLKQLTDFQDSVLRFGGPLTLSGYLESGFTSALNSGLVIEIGEDGYDDDYNKSTKYGDANFQLAARMAEQYGFSIDRNIPWRLVANLGSKTMQEYMHGIPLQDVPVDNKNLERCRVAILTGEGDLPDFFGYSQIAGYEDVVRHVNVYLDDEGAVRPGYHSLLGTKEMSNTQEIFKTVFDNFFFESWKIDMEMLKPYLVGFYNSLVDGFPVVSYYDSTEPCPEKRTKFIRREKVDPTKLNSDASHGDLWSLKAFYTIRKSERKNPKNVRLHASEIRKIVDIYDHYGAGAYQECLKYIQENLLGPYMVDPLTYYRVEDIIGTHGHQEATSVFSNVGRQNGVRRDLY